MNDRELRLKYKGDRCQACNKTVEQVNRRYLTSKGCFEFNHLDPSKKASDYANLIRRGISSDQLDELDKCILLCRECHAVYHAQECRGHMTASVTLSNGKVKTQRMPIYGIIDFEKPSSRFFCDEPDQLQIFRYRLGNGKVVERIARDLEKSLVRLFLATRRRRRLEIVDGKGLVLVATKIDESSVKIQYMVRFRLLKAALPSDDPDHPVMWTWHGKAIIKNLGVKEIGRITLVAPYLTMMNKAV